MRLKDEDWKGVESIFDAFQLLDSKGILSAELWRQFHCMRCREIWEYMSDSRSQTAVETAERFLSGVASHEEMQESFLHAAHAADDAWDKVQTLRVPGDPSLAMWPVSRSVDDAWIQYCAANAAKTCVEIAEAAVLFTTIPDTDVRAWRDARSSLVESNNENILNDQLRESVLQRWEEIRYGEEQRLVRVLRELVESQQSLE